MYMQTFVLSTGCECCKTHKQATCKCSVAEHASFGLPGRNYEDEDSFSRDVPYCMLLSFSPRSVITYFCYIHIKSNGLFSLDPLLQTNSLFSLNLTFSLRTSYWQCIVTCISLWQSLMSPESPQ